MSHRTNIRLSSDKRCRVACHKDDVKNGRCHCANRIEDESTPPVVRQTIVSDKRCMVACDINKVEKGLCQCANRLDDELKSWLPKAPAEDDYLPFY